MRAHRAAWASVVAYVVVAAALVAAAGCVDGSPFEPEMCEVRAVDGVVVVSYRTLQLCALPKVRTEVKRP